MSSPEISRIKLVPYTMLLASILFGIAGQLLMKKAMSYSDGSLISWSFGLQLAIALSVYTIGVMNWIVALKSVELSIAYPLTSLNYVGILLGSYYYFEEEITSNRIVGVILVFAGILFVVLGGKKKAQSNS
jgi:multidrug transporter EmrE-like cation transporter